MSADKIKKFFSRKKDEAKMKLNLGGGIGQGRKLNAEQQPASSSKKPSKDAYVPPKRKALSEEAKAAAAAALARVEKKDDREFNTSLAAIKARAKRELEAEKKLKEEAEKTETEAKSEAAAAAVQNKNLACEGVYFRCPLVSEEVLSKKEWRVKIKEFLYQQLENEKGLTACLIIYNCNVKEKVEACVETISKYIENILNHPDEEKYFKIRMNNRIFCEKVRYVEGALEFLQAAGFKEQEIDSEPFLIWSKDNLEDGNELSFLLDALRNAEILHLELDRNIQVIMPSEAKKVELPAEFFRITLEEIKREAELKTKALENAQVLKTKAMREREEQRILNRYRFALIRVKFPEGIYLQGTFNVYEKLSDIYEFVQSCLQDESVEFSLTIPGGMRFTEEDLDRSLYDLRLIPNTVLVFIVDTSLQPDVHYIKEELLMLIQPM